MGAEDALSEINSVEFADPIVDESFFATKGYQNGYGSDEDSSKAGLVARICRFFSDRALLKRIEEHQTEELKVFIAQKLFKLDGILCSEETRLGIINLAMLNSTAAADENLMELKYGREMAGWLQDRLFPSVADCSSILRAATREFERFKQFDPLCNWYYQSPETSTQVAARIAHFAQQMTARVKWSFLVEPGKFSCHLSEFMSEFHRLTLLTQNELAADETAKSAFNANHLSKARSKTIPCLDATRVRLDDGIDGRVPRSEVIGAIFNSDEQTMADNGDSDDVYGTADFIHASYVRGGPLLNTFILTQAPMQSTQYDFWRMIYQEKSRLIVMLCGAVEPSSLGPLDQSRLAGLCAYYWPQTEGSSRRFGDLTVKNVRVDNASDPIFTITHLELSMEGGDRFMLEHWQFDWQYMGDVHWPFRVLRMARLSPYPTVIHCFDGCGKSGTLVAVETALMHFLRGTPLDDHTVLLSALFVRMQRAQAVASPLQFLYIYRCLLHWISPYVTSTYQRISLGLAFKSIGFVDRYEEMSKAQGIALPPC